MKIRKHWNPYTLLVEMQNYTASVENSLVVSQYVKHKITIRLSNSAPKLIYSKGLKTGVQRKTCTQIFTAALFYKGQGKSPENMLSEGNRHKRTHIPYLRNVQSSSMHTDGKWTGGCWGWGEGAKRDQLLNGDGASFCVDENVLELGSGEYRECT